MKLRDRDAMDLDNIAESSQASQKINKKQFLSILKASYKHLDKDQIASIVDLVNKMLIAKQNGENLTVAFRDWNEDGTRRF